MDPRVGRPAGRILAIGPAFHVTAPASCWGRAILSLGPQFTAFFRLIDHLEHLIDVLFGFQVLSANARFLKSPLTDQLWHFVARPRMAASLVASHEAYKAEKSKERND